MHFGATLKLLRTSSGMTLRGLATEVGVSAAYLSRVEHGHDPPPTPDRLRAIARALGVPPEALTDLVDELRPDALEWLGRTATGRQLAAELRRRRLGPAQLARVLDFVEDQFPHAGPAALSAADLLAPDRVLVGVVVDDLHAALEIASLRLAPRAAAALLEDLNASEATCSSAVGGGLMVPHAAGHAEVPTGCLVLLARPLPTTTPDGLPVRAVFAVAGVGPQVGLLARVAHLADPALLASLAEERSPEAVLKRIGALS
jgi:nitrogen PTS system EIIA component